jgi:hypothetical protein
LYFLLCLKLPRFAKNPQGILENIGSKFIIYCYK